VCPFAALELVQRLGIRVIRDFFGELKEVFGRAGGNGEMVHLACALYFNVHVHPLPGPVPEPLRLLKPETLGIVSTLDDFRYVCLKLHWLNCAL
jgi:hypothetical protein